MYHIVLVVTLLLAISSRNLSNAEYFHVTMTVGDVQQCLQNSDVYFLGNSVSRGTFFALRRILGADKSDHDMPLSEFSFQVLHNRTQEKLDCGVNRMPLEFAGVGPTKSCYRDFEAKLPSKDFMPDATSKPYAAYYYIMQRLFMKSFFDITDKAQAAKRNSERRVYVIFNAGLDDSIHQDHEGFGGRGNTDQNCTWTQQVVHDKLEMQIDSLVDWAANSSQRPGMDITLRTTTPVCEYRPGYHCFNHNCTHMNQVVYLQNEVLREKVNNRTRGDAGRNLQHLHLVDGWKRLQGTCVRSFCGKDGQPLYCNSARCPDYDDWVHGARLAYEMLYDWLVEIGCSDSGDKAHRNEHGHEHNYRKGKGHEHGHGDGRRGTLYDEMLRYWLRGRV